MLPGNGCRVIVPFAAVVVANGLNTVINWPEPFSVCEKFPARCNVVGTDTTAVVGLSCFVYS
jgi:hypothetical protein